MHEMCGSINFVLFSSPSALKVSSQECSAKLRPTVTPKFLRSFFAISRKVSPLCAGSLCSTSLKPQWLRND